MKNKIYFLSDAHLGSVSHINALSEEKREELLSKGGDFALQVDHSVERKLCNWLEKVSADAQAIYLLGDIFDYWFEYRNVVPRGFTRFLGKLSELTDAGIEIHFFIGNHDIWLTDYLIKECGLVVHREPVIHTLHGKKFFLAHGDGLGDDSKSFMLLRRFFHSQICRKMFAAIHPRWTVALAHKWSHSRRAEDHSEAYKGEDNEPLIVFAKNKLKEQSDINYFIFGHRHILLDIVLQHTSKVTILGDWITYFSYAVFDGENLSLEVLEE